MNDIAGEDERDSETALFYGIALKLVDDFRICLIEYRTYTAGAHLADHLVLVSESGKLVELPYFLFESHSRQKSIDTTVYLSFRAGSCSRREGASKGEGRYDDIFLRLHG